VASMLSCLESSRGLFLNEVIRFFNLPNPSSHTMALGSTQPLTEMSTRNVPGDKGRPARKAEILTTIYESIFYKMWEPDISQTNWPPRPDAGINLPFCLYNYLSTI
jgi:hypothetical protein